MRVGVDIACPPGIMVDQDEGVFDLPLRRRASPDAASQDLILEFRSEQPSIFTIEVAPPIAPDSQPPGFLPAWPANRGDAWRAHLRRLFERISAVAAAAAGIASRGLASARTQFTPAARTMRAASASALSVNRWDAWQTRMHRFSRRRSASRAAAVEIASRLLASASARFRATALVGRERISAAGVAAAAIASRLLAAARAEFTSTALAVRRRGDDGHLTVAPWWGLSRSRVALIGIIAVPVFVRLFGPASEPSQLVPGTREMSAGVGLPTLTAVALPREQWPMAASPVLPGESPSLAQPARAEPPQAALKAAPGTSPRPVDPLRDDRRAIQTVLGGYRDALSTLDVHAVAAVWPTADVAALQRQFARIDDQNLEYERCGISIADATATASCTGVIESGLRAGQRRLHSARMQWRFTLEKKAKRWLIRTVSTERSVGTSAATNLATVRSPE
jgi:hypothetical protein